MANRCLSVAVKIRIYKYRACASLLLFEWQFLMCNNIFLAKMACRDLL